MIAARSLIALFSLPAVAGFARTPDWDGMSIEVAAEGYMPPNDVILGLPDDKCTKLEDPDAASRPKVLTDEWCGSRKTEDACVAGEVLKQGDKTILTTNGYVVMYDLCAWDQAFHDKQGNQTQVPPRGLELLVQRQLPRGPPKPCPLLLRQHRPRRELQP